MDKLPIETTGDQEVSSGLTRSFATCTDSNSGVAYKSEVLQASGSVEQWNEHAHTSTCKLEPRAHQEHVQAPLLRTRLVLRTSVPVCHLSETGTMPGLTLETRLVGAFEGLPIENIRTTQVDVTSR